MCVDWLVTNEQFGIACYSKAYFNIYTGGPNGPPGPTSWPTNDKKLAHHCMGPRPLIIATLHNIALIINALKDENKST